MSARALIVAIEEYASVEGGALAASLPGTLQAATEFRDWLVEKWRGEGRPAAETQVLFCSEPRVAGERGARRADVIGALAELKQTGRNTTDELYVYFSGHGFGFEGIPGTRSDVLVTADFQSGMLTPMCCLKLDEIVTWLRSHLGPGHHYYFIDACRNILTVNQVQVANQLPWDPQDSEEATTYVLQSTVPGAPALVSGPFAQTLVAGLRGAGKAKVWEPAVTDSMLVKYESLRRFLKERLRDSQPITHRVEGEDGEADAVLARIRPVPQCTLTLNLNAAAGDEKGTVTLRRSTSAEPREIVFEKSPLALTLEPDFYSVRLALDGASVVPVGDVPVELFEDAQVEFELLPADTRGLTMSGAAFAREKDPSLAVDVPDGVSYKLRNVETGREEVFRASTRATLSAGTYAVTLSSREGVTLRRGEIALRAGDAKDLDLGAWGDSVPHRSIADRLPGGPGGLDFSESLNELVTDPDLGLWLALLGGGRILGAQGDYSKIARFPLADFSRAGAGESPVYVLAGFEDGTASLQAGLSTGAEVPWQAAERPAGMAGIRHVAFSPRPGPLLVSMQVAGQAPFTVASLASPNRGTLLVLTLDEEGAPRVSQFLLPLGHLVAHLPREVASRLRGRNHLRDVMFLARASRAFRKRRRLAQEFTGHELQELLYSKWLDPIGASLAAYELVRRGDKTDLPEVVRNMKEYFPDLPDTAALARLAGKPRTRRRGVPLFLDGVRAFSDFADWLPLPAGQLDFHSPWTTWQAAVRPAR